MSGGREAEVQQRIGNLNRYLESIQAKQRTIVREVAKVDRGFGGMLLG